MILTAVILAATSLMFKIDLVKANLVVGGLLLLEGSLSFIGIGVMASVMPLLFPERGEQMTHVFIPWSCQSLGYITRSMCSQCFCRKLPSSALPPTCWRCA